MSEYCALPCPALPIRAAEGHKGTFGRVLLVGGSIGMSGAVTLSAVAALRSGSGLVTAVVPQSIQSIVAAYEPSLMTFGLPSDTEGQLSTSGAEALTEVLEGRDAVGIGPGLSRSSESERLLRILLEGFTGPIVIDADALYHLAQSEWLTTVEERPPLVLTPHPGEFARLSGLEVAEIEANRIEVAVQYAATHRLVLVLKGHRTIVTDGTSVFVNSTGNSGMATGGSGDVLTGIITSLIGQGMTPLTAAALGVHSHGLAGDLAAAALSQQGLIASDLLKFLPAAWAKQERDALPD